MDPESFMKQVSIDAENRAADKKIRTEKAETLKTQASKAFKRGEYELALSRYDKAIDQIKDSCLLYTNRALTLLKLKQYEKVCKTVMQMIRDIKTHTLWKELWETVGKMLKNEHVVHFVREIFNFAFMQIFKKISFANFSSGTTFIIQAIYLYIIQQIFTHLINYICDEW